ncbi:ovarian-specific serine/threonine-protein kinase Lok [Aethina tumida]|uniref:ovarian-specific serine/threonine-protein kinase Lok n=1 Tax=Aethina tumida TaxID=116153 RepID=UPI00096B4334|nr:ovarian-specific serine/threonine-protein kinase Lok [Aethina tumida]
MSDYLTPTPPQSQHITPPEEIQTPWGRLIARRKELDSVDLITDSISLGRDAECDIVLYRETFPQNLLQSVSKLHFAISKDGDGPVYITDFSKNGTFVNQTKVGKNRKFILQNNDNISVGNKRLIIYMFKLMDSIDNKYLPASLRKRYEAGAFLGKGAAGEVRLVYEKTTCKKFAVKKINKGKFHSNSNLHQLNHPKKIYSEINILQEVNHPCIISMEDLVETEDDVYIILEYMQGGELTDRVEKHNLTESQVKFYFYQITLAVQHLHSKGITHRDLKPANVLLSSTRFDSLVKVSDFGLSKETHDNIMSTICGTPHYVAPEVLDGRYKEYNNQVDIWSLGVILFYMLSKKLPFDATDRPTLGAQIVMGQYTMNDPAWQGISVQAKDLVQNMLKTNPKERITVEGILKHPWIMQDMTVRYKVHGLMSCASKSDDCEPFAKRFRLDED